MRSLIPRLAADGIEIGHAVVASGARVALGDEIGAILGARMVVMLIGERPGLSAPDSLGAYLTFAPEIGPAPTPSAIAFPTSTRGLSYDEAAFKIAWLIREGLAREMTGVALKDESGDATPQRIATIHASCDKSATLSAVIAACARICRRGARLRDAAETCYTSSRQIYRMFSRASANQTWPTSGLIRAPEPKLDNIEPM